MTKFKNPDLEIYTVPADVLEGVAYVMEAALNEAGFPMVRTGPTHGRSSAPDYVWVRACNMARAAAGLPEFPNVSTWRAWCDNAEDET